MGSGKEFIMRIGLLTPTLSMEHGTGHYSLELIRNLRQAGLQLEVVTPLNTNITEDLPLHHIFPLGDRANFLKLCMAIPRVLRALKDCDIIHSTVERYAIIAAHIARNRPVLITAHGSFMHIRSAWRWPLSSMYKRAFNRSSCVICVSKHTASQAKIEMPNLSTKIIHSGISTERFRQFVKQPNKDFLTILCVAAIKRRKGIVHLMRAIATVREHYPGIRCVVIGSSEYGPDYLTEVQSEITRLRLHDCVQLLGHVKETTLLHWYSKADVFVLPAVNDDWRFEGYGLSYLEAGAAQLPVIGTTNCGAEDAIEHGLTGLLVPEERLRDELPKAILRLLSNPNMRKRMGIAGRKKAEGQSWQRFTEQMISVYEAAISDNE